MEARLWPTLPLVIDPRTRASGRLARLKVSPTRAQTHAATQLLPTEAASVARWNELPLVTAVNAPHGQAGRDGAAERDR